MKACVSMPQGLVEAAQEVFPGVKLSHLVQRGLIALLEKEGLRVVEIPATYRIERI